MADSGIHSPTGPSGPEKAPRQTVGDQTVRVERSPESLRDVRRARSVEGEVAGRNRDGSVSIRTPEGDVDVRLRQNAPDPRPGQRVTIDIPAGNPPRTATLRLTATPSGRGDIVPSDPAVRHTSTPLTLDLGRPPRANPPVTGTLLAASLTVVRSPEAGQTIRLVPTPLSQIQPLPLAAQFSETIMQTSAFSAMIATLKTGSETLAQLLSITSQDIVKLPITVNQSFSDSRPVSATGEAMPPAPGRSFFSFSTPINPGASPVPPANLPGLPPIATVLNTLPPRLLPASAISGTATSGLSVSLPAPRLGTADGFSPVPSASNPGASPARPGVLDASILAVLPAKPLIVPAGSINSAHRPHAFLAETASHSVLNAPAAGTMTATVVGTTALNLPVLSMLWPQSGLLQTFTLQAPAEAVQAGTQLQVSPLSGFPAAPPFPGAMPQTLMQFLTPSPWPVFEETLQILGQQDPQAGYAFARMLPNAVNPSQLGTAALLFLAAVRSGDVGSWMGERAMNVLRRAEGRGGNTLSRLSGEMSTLARVQAEPAGDWRAMALPLAYNGEINKIALYWRDGGNGRNDEDGKDKEKQTRFIFDLNLSAMGELQLDGLLRGRRLDLVVRTRAPLSPAMQQDMRRTYAGAIGSTGLEGDISFQDDPERWVRVIQEDKMLRSET
ncbi:MAG: hypothetical protein EOM26_10895 [Alphaproteobacteria bacterium]|nr:hypothetical protein [Alphaproteobacteria bacterium]